MLKSILLMGFAFDSGLIGAQAQVLNGDLVQARHAVVLQLHPDRTHYFQTENGPGWFLHGVGRRLHRADDADDLADIDAPPLPRQPVTAARASYSRQDAGADELLEHLFQ